MHVAESDWAKRGLLQRSFKGAVNRLLCYADLEVFSDYGVHREPVICPYFVVSIYFIKMAGSYSYNDCIYALE